MTEAHTATPWTWTHHADSENECHYELHPAEFECGEGDSILYHGANWPMTEADRAFILRAVNSHAALVEAFNAIHEWAMARDGTPEADETALREIATLASAALATAREG